MDRNYYKEMPNLRQIPNKMNNSKSQAREPILDCSNIPQNCNTSEIHTWRMRTAVLWSIILQFIFLFVFILLVNLDIFHPLSWLVNCFRVFLSFKVWLKLIVLVVIIYIQGEVCKKDYVTGPKYHSSRFRKMRNVFTVRNLLMLVLHMVIGTTIFWIYSSISRKPHQSLIRPCESSSFKQSEKCLHESKLFLMLGGVWLGMYYFANDYIFGSRTLSFPLIQQYKLYRIKAALKTNIQRSVRYSVMPTIIFLFLYYCYGGFVRSKLIELLSIRMDREPIDTVQGLMNIQLIFFLWLFSSIFIVALQMMELLFNVYLTEHCEFPITVNPAFPAGNYLSLLDSLGKTNIPIIHHLGYLDLITISTKSKKRRGEIFTLSQPGGHPHSWNGVFKECSNLIQKFTCELNQSLQQPGKLSPSKEETAPTEPVGFHFHSHTLRKLGSPISNADMNIARPKEYQSFIEVWFNNIQKWLKVKQDQFYKKPFMAYFFSESSDSRIKHFLCQSQPVIWAVQSLAFLAAASLSEDQYGIVQKDLPEVIMTIVSLKQVLDKLFKQNLIIVKKSLTSDPLNVQMKYLLKTSVKRSLYIIAVTFGPYIKDLKLPYDAEIQLNNFTAFKEVL